MVGVTVKTGVTSRITLSGGVFCLVEGSFVIEKAQSATNRAFRA